MAQLTECPDCHGTNIYTPPNGYGGWCVPCSEDQLDAAELAAKPAAKPAAKTKKVAASAAPANPYPEAPRGKKRRYEVKWQRVGCKPKVKLYSHWPAAWRLTQKLEAEKTDPKRRWNVQEKALWTSSPVESVAINLVYVERMSYEEALVEAMIECACGCGKWFYPSRSTQRFLDATCRARFDRAKKVIVAVLCDCGCGEPFYPARPHQRFINATHRKRANRVSRETDSATPKPDMSRVTRLATPKPQLQEGTTEVQPSGGGRPVLGGTAPTDLKDQSIPFKIRLAQAKAERLAEETGRE